MFVCFAVSTWRKPARVSPEVDRRRTGTTTTRTEQRSRSRPASQWVSKASVGSCDTLDLMRDGRLRSCGGTLIFLAMLYRLQKYIERICLGHHYKDDQCEQALKCLSSLLRLWYSDSARCQVQCIWYKHHFEDLFIFHSTAKI